MHTVIYVIPFIASMEAVINDIDLKKMYIVTPTKKLAVAGQDRVPLQEFAESLQHRLH